MRFLHFSDIHLEQGFKEVSSRKFLNKRLIGWMNLRLRRAQHYRDAPAKVRALADLVEAESIDVALCSGDYTALGTEPEIAFARECVEPIRQAASGYVTVPGNHDVYLPDALGVFESHFADVLTTDLPELVRDEVWPQVRLFGEDVAVITVNSSRPNPPIMRSSGRIPDAQLEGLADALAHPKVAGRFAFVMTHYAPRLKSGRPDTPNHGLENADELLAVCGSARGAILHGHVHKCYSVTVPETAMTLFGAGSTTQAGAEGLWVYDIGADGSFARRGHWNGERYELADARVDL